MNKIYRPKNDEPSELYRNFIMVYHYLLLNNKSEDDYRKILKYFYQEKAIKYFNFFYNNFLNYQNIFFFTLYNQMPLEFLPLPESDLYLNYPLITFSDKDTFFLESKSPINLSKYFISRDIYDIKIKWKEGMSKWFGEEIINKKLNEIKPDLIENNNQELYDDFHIVYNTQFIRNLNNSFLKNKILFIFINNPIICLNYNFVLDELNIYSYYKKINFNKYIKIKKHKIFNLKDIKYISFYKNIIKDDIYKCFLKNKLKSETILYQQQNKDYYNDTYIPSYFTINPKVRILDPLYLENSKYILTEYKLKKDIDILNITSNIYLNNEITNRNFNLYQDDILKCYKLNDDIENNLKFCDYDFVNPTLKVDEINYNKKNALLLIIWKNKRIVDNKTSFNYFLNLLDIKSFFNLFSLIKNKKKIELLGEEFFISEPDLVSKLKVLQ